MATVTRRPTKQSPQVAWIAAAFLILLPVTAIVAVTQSTRTKESSSTSTSMTVADIPVSLPATFSTTDFEQTKQWWQQVTQEAETRYGPEKEDYLKQRCQEEIPIGSKVRWQLPVKNPDVYGHITLLEQGYYSRRSVNVQFQFELGRDPLALTYEQKDGLRPGDLVTFEATLVSHDRFLGSKFEEAILFGLTDSKVVEVDKGN